MWIISSIYKNKNSLRNYCYIEADNSDKSIFLGILTIDISDDGNQPMLNETKDIVLVCNEIYNYINLEDLIKGHNLNLKVTLK